MLTSYKTGRPAPLEVVATKPACDVHDFANKEQTLDRFAFHRFRREMIGIHTAKRHLSRFSNTITFLSKVILIKMINLDLSCHALIGESDMNIPKNNSITYYPSTPLDKNAFEYYAYEKAELLKLCLL